MTTPESNERRGGRPTIPFERGLEQRLLIYAAAAGATLVTAQSAAARVIFTSANALIDRDEMVPVDLNHDGVTDLVIVERRTYGIKLCNPIGDCAVFLSADAGNASAGVVGGYAASALRAGSPIGPGNHFVQGTDASMAEARADIYSSTELNVYGNFRSATDRFLGLKFVINGQTHYGWVAFRVVSAGFKGLTPEVRAYMSGFAYEDVPNQPIRAGQISDADFTGGIPPQPATLGLLALGAPGLDIWRLRKRES